MLIKRVAEIVMALTLYLWIERKQRLAERLQRFAVFLHFVSRGARVELDPIGLSRIRIFLQRLLEVVVGFVKFILAIKFQAGRCRARDPCTQQKNRGSR